MVIFCLDIAEYLGCVLQFFRGFVQAGAGCAWCFLYKLSLILCSQRTSVSVSSKRRQKSSVTLAAAVAKKVVEHKHHL